MDPDCGVVRMIIQPGFLNGRAYKEISPAELGLNDVAVGGFQVSSNWVDVQGFTAFSLYLIFDNNVANEVNRLRVAVNNQDKTAWHTYGPLTRDLGLHYLTPVRGLWAVFRTVITLPFATTQDTGETDQFGEVETTRIYKEIRFELVFGEGNNFTGKLFCFA